MHVFITSKKHKYILIFLAYTKDSIPTSWAASWVSGTFLHQHGEQVRVSSTLQPPAQEPPCWALARSLTFIIIVDALRSNLVHGPFHTTQADLSDETPEVGFRINK